MIFFRKNFIKIIITIIIVSFLIVSPYPLFTKITRLNYSFNKEYEFEFSGVIELWNIDTFEGGSVSRTTFLEKRAVEFEKLHKGTLILVKNISLEQLKLNLENGKNPSLITFGIGVGSLIYDKIIDLSESYGVREDLIKSSTLNSCIKALPIMLGGYNLITNQEKLSTTELNTKLNNTLIYSNIEYNLPLMSLFVNELQINNNSVNFSVDSFSAYDKFINNQYCSLIGTQRDFYRCKNRERNMKMQCDYTFLGGYSDLIVYGSVFQTNNEIQKISERFLEYLVKDSSQEKLSNIGLFSVLNKSIYSDSEYKEYEKILLNNLKTINVFYSDEILINLRDMLEKYFYEKQDNKTEILKYLL